MTAAKPKVTEHISVTRSAAGATVVMVTLEEESFRSQYASKSSALKVLESTELARNGARALLEQIKRVPS